MEGMLDRYRFADLVEQVDRLPAPADEVPRRHIHRLQDRAETSTIGPGVQGPDESEVELALTWNSEPLLNLPHLALEIEERLNRPAYPATRQADTVVALSALVDHRRDNGSELRR